jgi:hypothetical protein
MIVEYWLSPASSGSCADMGTRVAVQEGRRKKGSPWGERRRPHENGGRGRPGRPAARELATPRGPRGPVGPGAEGPRAAAFRPSGHLFAGAVAGAVSRTATAPLETLRLAAMAGTLSAGGRIDAVAAAVVKRHGWRALYRGEAPGAAAPGGPACLGGRAARARSAAALRGPQLLRAAALN